MNYLIIITTQRVVNMRCLVLISCILMISTSLLYAEVVNMTQQEEKQWLRHLLPLPHEISIQNKISLNPADVSVIVGKNAGDIERNAAAELNKLFEKSAGTTPKGKKFSIIIGIADKNGKLDGHSVKNIERLKTLPNSDQAYIIQPDGENCLLLSALHGKGIYYAALTLSQLLEPFMSADGVTIPLADIVDWPDMEERGIWNFPDPEIYIPWMASKKLNYGKMVNTTIHTVERGKKNHATIDKDIMLQARLSAFNYLPFIMHFNFLHEYGLFREYPELAGVGDSALAEDISLTSLAASTVPPVHRSRFSPKYSQNG